GPCCDPNGRAAGSCGPARLHAAFSAEQQDICRAQRKQAVGHQAGVLVEFGLELAWLDDAEVVHVEDDVAVVGYHAFTPHRITAEFDDLARHVAARHRNHFHRQREAAEYIHPLAAIGDTHEFPGRGSDDFFTRQRCATALDELQVFVALIGTVDIDVHAADAVELHHRNAVGLQAPCALFRAGHRGVDFVFQGGERVDEIICRRARPHTDDGVGCQALGNEVEGSFGNGLLEGILGHVGEVPAEVDQECAVYSRITCRREHDRLVAGSCQSEFWCYSSVACSWYVRR